MFEVYGSTVSVILAWSVLLLLFTGIGLLVRHLCRARKHTVADMLLAFWVGWAATVAYLQIWHLFWPVSAITSVLPGFAALLGLWLARDSLWQKVHRSRPYGWRLIILLPLIIGFLILLIWAAGHAINDDYRFDDGLYHIQDTQWMTNYNIVPGLGNLHVRFAYNTSHTLYISLLKTMPELPPARHVAHGTLFVAFALQVSWSSWQIVTRKKTDLTNYLYLLLFPAVLFISNGENFLASIKNDYPVLLLGIILSGEMLRELQSDRKPDFATTVSSSLIACVSVAIKVNMAIFAGGLLLILLFKAPRRTMRISVPIFAMICAVWMLRGVIISGYPLYPSDVAPFPVDWRMPTDVVNDDMRAIVSWARIPDVSWEETLGHMNWLPTWWERVRAYDFTFTEPLLLGTIAFIVTLLAATFRRSFQPLRSRLWFLPLVALVALIYWFFSAPEPRFAWHVFWVLGASTTIIATHRIGLPGKAVAFPLLALFMTYTISMLHWPPYRYENQSFAPPSTSPYTYTYTDNGVKVYYPVDSTQCWEAPLPCTLSRQAKAELKSRDGKSLANGFVLVHNRPSKGAYFALFENTQPADIVPPVSVSTELPIDGILIGDGWYDLESWDGGQQRWVANNAQFYITEPSLDLTTLCMDVAPGPSIIDEPAQIALLDESGIVVTTFTFVDATTLAADLPLTDEERVFRYTLVVENGGEVYPPDGRILNLSVANIYWCD